MDSLLAHIGLHALADFRAGVPSAWVFCLAGRSHQVPSSPPSLYVSACQGLKSDEEGGSRSQCSRCLPPHVFDHDSDSRVNCALKR